ncbi:MAG: DUF4387 domain-containing protein [Spirochaetales bacterium]|nr:DUF4387 domain-containing protein [Spirochaetales bacterium]
MAKKNIREIAKVIRSKNSSPFEITFDIIFKDLETFNKVKENNLITKSLIASLYKLKEDEIMDIIYFMPALAVKFGMKRIVTSGAPGDTDVYGAQQHGPLLNIELDL